MSGQPTRSLLVAIVGGVVPLAFVTACQGSDPATANTACADYAPTSDVTVTRHIAAIQVADWIDASKPPGPHDFTDVRDIVDKITDSQMAAAARLAAGTCRLHPADSVVSAVAIAIGKRELAIPHELEGLAGN